MGLSLVNLHFRLEFGVGTPAGKQIESTEDHPPDDQPVKEHGKVDWRVVVPVLDDTVKVVSRVFMLVFFERNNFV